MIYARVYYVYTGNLCDIVEFADPVELIDYLYGFYRDDKVYRWSIF